MSCLEQPPSALFTSVRGPLMVQISSFTRTCCLFFLQTPLAVCRDRFWFFIIHKRSVLFFLIWVTAAAWLLQVLLLLDLLLDSEILAWIGSLHFFFSDIHHPFLDFPSSGQKVKSPLDLCSNRSRNSEGKSCSEPG